MSLRQVLTIYNAERQLTDDETALLNTLRRMNDNERELLVKGLAPEKKSKKAETAKKRNLERCSTCDFTRRAAHHKDDEMVGYHAFESPKRPRASSLQQQIQGRAKAVAPTADSDPDAVCSYKYDSGMICDTSSGNPVHDPTQGYAGYHEFQPAEQAASASGGD